MINSRIFFSLPDRTSMMPKIKKKNKPASQTRRFKKLIKANVNPKTASRLCELQWETICQLIPQLESSNPVVPLTPSKKTKKKRSRSKLKVRHELQFMKHPPREHEPDSALFWHNPWEVQQNSLSRHTSPSWGTTQQREHQTNNEPYLDQPYRFPQPYSNEVLHTLHSTNQNEAGPSQVRGCETNSRKRRRTSEVNSHWEPPQKLMTTSHVDRGQWNLERDRSPLMIQPDEIPMDYSPSFSIEHTELKYLDAEDALQVKVNNGMRAVKLQFNEIKEEKPFSDDAYEPQKTTSESGVSVNYWPGLDRPSRLGLRNETHPPKHAHATYSYSEDKKFREDPRNYQKISWESNVNQNYKESDRPSRDGLRNEIRPTVTICIDDDSNEPRGPDKVIPVKKTHPRICFDLTDTLTEKGSGPHWHQPESFEKRDANVKKNTEPIRVGIRNITAMTKQQMKLVHQSINKAIVQIAVQGAGPKFLGSTFKNGSIRMICENPESRKWLEKVIPTLKPWPGASLSIAPQDELPKTTVSILIPNKEGVTVATALELLRVQNPGLDTDNWKVLKLTKTYSGQIALLSIDEISFKALKLLNFKANLGIDKVTFRVKGDPVKTPILGNSSAKEVPLASSTAYTERQTDPKTSTGGNNGLKLSKNMRRRMRRAQIAVDRPVVTKPEDEDTKSLSSIKLSPYESYSPSDWVTWF